ncbi:hypothetical protein BK687P1_00025 [Bacteroides phage BK687P1]|nr:hypothetical protein BK687P1_00025 [Bacteroides phage BK687P1]
MMKEFTKWLGQMVLAIAAGIALGCILVCILNNL